MRLIRRLGRIKFGSKAVVVGAFLFGIVTASAAGAMASRTIGDHMANATFAKLGGDPDVVLHTIAGEVVKQLSAKSGPLSGAQKQLVDRLGKLADRKLSKIDPSTLLDDVKGKVVAAGLDKVDEFDPQAIVDDVTNQIVDQVTAQMADIDIEALASSVLDDTVENVDITKITNDYLASLNVRKIVNDWLNSIDIRKIISEVAHKEMQEYAASQKSGGLLGGLFGR